MRCWRASRGDALMMSCKEWTGRKRRRTKLRRSNQILCLLRSLRSKQDRDAIIRGRVDIRGLKQMNRLGGRGVDFGIFGKIWANFGIALEGSFLNYRHL